MSYIRKLLNSFVSMAFIISLFMFVDISEAKMKCTHDDSQRLEKSFSLGASFQSVVSHLDSAMAEYMIFSGDQRVSMELVQSKGIKALSPIYVLINFGGIPRDSDKLINTPIREDEILTLLFDRNGNLIEKSCKKIFTGP